MSTTQTELVAKLRAYGEKARPSGSGIHVPQYGRMSLAKAREVVAFYEKWEYEVTGHWSGTPCGWAVGGLAYHVGRYPGRKGVALYWVKWTTSEPAAYFRSDTDAAAFAMWLEMLAKARWEQGESGGPADGCWRLTLSETCTAHLEVLLRLLDYCTEDERLDILVKAEGLAMDIAIARESR